MKFKLSLELRLNVSIALSMLLMMMLGFVWAVRDARASVNQEARASVDLALGLIDAALIARESKPSDLQEWIRKIGHLDRIRHLKITVSSTPKEMTSPDRTSRRLQDGVPEWFRWAVVSQPILASREVQIGAERPAFIHIESYAEDEIREAWNEVRRFLVLLVILAVSTNLCVHWIAGRALRPVSLILRGLNAIEEGDYETRLPEFGLAELDRLSKGINHLSLTLRDSRDENRALTRHSLTIQEDERRSIAQEIHDEFGQNLAAIKMMSGALGGNSETNAKVTEEIQRVCDRLFGVVRALMRRLRPMVLEDLGLKAAVSDLRDHWRLTSPHLEIVIQCDPCLEGLKGELSLEIYRITQEALTNTFRHSDASEALVQIAAEDRGTISLVLKDNGQGLGQKLEGKGFGLLGMRERVASLKGQFKLINRPGEGLEIRIVLPVQKSQDD